MVFEIAWLIDPHMALDTFQKERGVQALSGQLDSDDALTEEDSASTILSQTNTRSHTPNDQPHTMRIIKVDRLGSGSFGEVHKAIDMDSGDYIAVKTIYRPELGWQEKAKIDLQREIEVLKSSHHVRYVSCK